MDKLTELRDQYSTHEQYFIRREEIDSKVREDFIERPVAFHGPIQEGTRRSTALRKLRTRVDAANIASWEKRNAAIRELDGPTPQYEKMMRIRDDLHGEISALLSSDQKFMTHDDFVSSIGGQEALSALEASSNHHPEVNVTIIFEESSPGQRDPHIHCDLTMLMPIIEAWDDEKVRKFISSSAFEIDLWGGHGGHGADDFYETTAPSAFFYFLRNRFGNHITDDLYRRAEAVRGKTFSKASLVAA